MKHWKYEVRGEKNSFPPVTFNNSRELAEAIRKLDDTPAIEETFVTIRCIPTETNTQAAEQFTKSYEAEFSKRK